MGFPARSRFDVDPLLNLRLKANRNQDDLAKEIGIARQKLGKIENGRGGITVKMICDIASALDCSYEEILGNPNL